MRTRFKQSFYFIINNCDSPHPELRNSQLEPVSLNLVRKMCISIDRTRRVIFASTHTVQYTYMYLSNVWMDSIPLEYCKIKKL